MSRWFVRAIAMGLAIVALAGVAVGEIGVAYAKDPAGLATNDFGNNGDATVPASAYAPGKKVRESKEYKKENPDASQRDYFERGGATANHDSRARARTAYKAARYEGPKNGYEEGTPHGDGPRPKPGGGKYSDKMSTDPATIVGNIYKYVEDVTYPKGCPAAFDSDEDVIGSIERGGLDIGKPAASGKFMCIETIHLFTSLVRELGFPVQEKNVLVSYSDGTYMMQTAGANVYYGGKWHFFDPWNSFADTKDYLGKKGHSGYDGTGKHDVDIWGRTSAPNLTPPPGGTTDYGFTNRGTTSHTGWRKIKRHTKNGAKIETETYGVRVGVRDQEGRTTGGTSGEQQQQIENSSYVPYDGVFRESALMGAPESLYERELITLIYSDDEPAGAFAYELLVLNDSEEPQGFVVDLDGMSATIDITVEPSLVEGVVEPGEIVSFGFKVFVGERLPQFPDAVGDLHVANVDGSTVELGWSAVEGAVLYRVVRGDPTTGNLCPDEMELVGVAEETSYTLEVDGPVILGVEAINVIGLPSGFDPEGGSTTFAEPEMLVWEWSFGSRLEALGGELGFATGFIDGITGLLVSVVDCDTGEPLPLQGAAVAFGFAAGGADLRTAEDLETVRIEIPGFELVEISELLRLSITVGTSTFTVLSSMPTCTKSCACTFWSDVTISWWSPLTYSEDPTNHHLTEEIACGDATALAVLSGEGVTANAVMTCLGTSGSSCTATYDWVVSGPGGYTAAGQGNHVSFIPHESGTYAVTLTASCGTSVCSPCTFDLEIGIYASCGCSRDPAVTASWWSPLTYAHDPWNHSLTTTTGCNGLIGVAIYEGDSISVASAATCSPAVGVPGCDPPVETWEVTGPSGFTATGTGPTADFVPPEGGTYTVSFAAACDGSTCSSCSVTLSVGTFPPCNCLMADGIATSWWSPLTHSSDPSNHHLSATHSCGDAAAMAVYEGTSVCVVTAASCVPGVGVLSCDPPLASWQVTGPSGFSASGFGSSASFIPPVAGVYSLLLGAACDSNVCAPCHLTLDIGLFPSDSEAPPAEDAAGSEADALRDALVRRFVEAAGPLSATLAAQGASIHFPGTLIAGSGTATLLIAPVISDEPISIEEFVYEGGLFGAAWLTSPAVDSEIPAGLFALRFRPGCGEPSEVDYVDADGVVRATVEASSGFPDDPAVLLKHGIAWLEDAYDAYGEVSTEAGFTIIDLEIRLGGPDTEVWGSFLFWKTRLFKDP